MSGEIRQNKATKEWVIYAPARGKRPHDFQQARRAERPALPPYDSGCPFCPGNEQLLPDVLAEAPATDSNGWQTRVVPNKYPALTPDGSITRYTRGQYVAMQGYGHHEVIIESPQHNRDLATLPHRAVETVVETYHRRYVELQADARNVLILIFRNHGPRAGASLSHPHSQLIATGMIPRHLRMREEEAQSYFDEWGRCVYCDMLSWEQADRRRVVLENESFVAFVPFAAEVPFETWIVPRRHQSDFGRTTATERVDLARALREILARLYTKLHDPDYNYVINSAPRMHEPHLHWFVRLRPRLVTRAGFEIGSGMRINPSLPEADAAFLNEPTDSLREEETA